MGPVDIRHSVHSPMNGSPSVHVFRPDRIYEWLMIFMRERHEGCLWIRFINVENWNFTAVVINNADPIGSYKRPSYIQVRSSLIMIDEWFFRYTESEHQHCVMRTDSVRISLCNNGWNQVHKWIQVQNKWPQWWKKSPLDIIMKSHKTSKVPSDIVDSQKWV